MILLRPTTATIRGQQSRHYQLPIPVIASHEIKIIDIKQQAYGDTWKADQKGRHTDTSITVASEEKQVVKLLSSRPEERFTGPEASDQQ